MAQPINHNAGFGSAAVTPPYYVERENAPRFHLNQFQSITTLRDFESTSFEELRLKDYTQGQGVVSGSSTEVSSKVPPCHVAVSIPFAHRTPFFPPSKISLADEDNPYLSKTIICRVGNDPVQDFYVHETLFTASSEFARMALKKDWKEAEDGVVPLPEDDTHSFGLYQQWLYTGNIFINRRPEPVQGQEHYDLLVKAYLLGEKLIDCNFKDTIIDCIIDKLRSSRMFDPRLTDVIYENTPTDSPLRRLWLDIYLHAGDPSWLDEKAIGDFVNADFLLELSKAQMRSQNGALLGSPAFLYSSCAYHEHSEGRCHRA